MHALQRVPRRAKELPRSTRACRSVRSAHHSPSSVRLVTFAVIAAHISRAHNVFDERRVPGPAWVSTDGPPGARLPEGP